ncbi:MAG TPA: NifU N-terminal domain-containing protein [Longimicrobiales bacterium]
MPETTIRFQPTPNPNAGKFIVNRKVVEGTSSKSFYNADDAADHPLAAALFELEGVASLFMVDDFVTVTKSADADWNALIPQVQAVMEQTFR